MWAVSCAVLVAGGAAAFEARPEPRPGSVAEVVRPEPRPFVVEVGRAAPVLRPGLGRSLIPQPRPAGLVTAAPVRRGGVLEALSTPRQPRRGSVCGDRSIRGTQIAPIQGRIAGCGVAAPVRVTEVDGVRLSQASVMDCDTALALKDWINDGVRPAVARTGGGLAELKVAAHYVCRTRNHKPGAKISEHGKGRAIDISALVLADGQEISVLDDWGRGRAGRILRASHGAACGPFGTVLGPEADRYHKDHFHFDTARYRSGSYCR